MRWRALSLSLLLSGFVLLATGCGLTRHWHEQALTRYHNSRLEVLARREAYGVSGIDYPRKPGPPRECRAEIEPLYKQAYEAQQQQADAWQALQDQSVSSVKLVREVAAALGQRNGAELTRLTPELSKAIDANAVRLDQWRQQRAGFEGGIQALQLKWQTLWPANTLAWDLEVEIDRLRRADFDAQIAAEAAANSENGKEAASDAARLAAQQLEQEHITALLQYHDAAYGRLASLYLGRQAQSAAGSESAPAAPEYASAVASQLTALEDTLAARYELDLGIEAELTRFETLTGYKLEELLELPRQGEAAPKGALSRRQVWDKLRSGKLPSLSGQKDRNLKGHRKEAVEISLARLEFYRQLDELLTRCISVRQRELARQWENVWPNPAVEMDVFEYAATLPEASAPEQAAAPADELP